ncbi:hypothetical protein SH1V18_21180 [Vallitalea longa]|uniref:SLH domain-containing protein n=1 Tax=Vallitalea longa TaxID=2936439 RepID=A0A9W5YEB3_9FIRM|nr:S-layer homology domain-containing protein [Vallitalea longa]GKX29638.1 hypothetical protein SH1V18_21180 [Vallitalea longa]
MVTKFYKDLTKILASILIIGFALFNAETVNAATLQDIDSSSDYAKQAILSLADKDIITGDGNGNFNPQNTVTRAEMITMIVRALEVDTTDVPDTPTFQDIPKTHWAYNYVEAAYREGIVKGLSKDTFGKNGQCTREQMTVMFVRSLGISNKNSKFTNIYNLADKDMISSWAKDAVEFSLASGLMNGTSDATFSPRGNAQRQQVAVVIHRLINNKENILESANETNDNSEDIKYTELYEALLNIEESATFNMSSILEVKGTTTEETVSIKNIGNGVLKGTDLKMTSTMYLTQKDLTIPYLTADIIIVDGKLFAKEAGSDIWVESTDNDLAELISIESDDLSPNNDELVDIYNDLPIEKGETVEIGGVNTTKYTLSLDMDTIMELYPEDFNDIDTDTQEIIDNMNLIYNMEFYVNEQNKLQKQIFKSHMQNEEITSDLVIEYTDFGIDVEITAPSLENIYVDTKEVIM